MPDTQILADHRAGRDAAPVGTSNWSALIPDARDVDIFEQWQAHVDAGRIGRRVARSPEIAAQHDRNAALFARLARGVRR